MDEREKRLEQVKRWKYFNPLLYEYNVLDHTKKLVWLLEELLPIIEKTHSSIDKKKTILLAKIHDDIEIVIDDITAAEKEQMTKEEKNQLEENEKKAVERLVKKYQGTMEGYSYRDLLKEALEKKTKEAKIMNMVDKFDSFGEALHEIHAGNKKFSKNINNSLPDPVNFYKEISRKKIKAMKGIEKLLQINHPILKEPETIEVKKIIEQGKKHSRESLKEETTNEFYNHWKRVIIERGGEEGIQILLKKFNNE